MIKFNINGTDIEITPEVLFLYEDPRRVEPVYTDKLLYPVVGTAMVKYNNPLNIKYLRPHNVYTIDDNYFIDMFGEIVPLNNLDDYIIKYPDNLSNRYSVYNEINFNTKFRKE